MPLYSGSFIPVTYSKQYLAKTSRDFMEGAKKRAAQNGIVFTGRTVIGNESTEIVNFATKNKFGLVVIGARGLRGVGEVFLGSVSHGVVHKSKIPVLIVK